MIDFTIEWDGRETAEQLREAVEHLVISMLDFGYTYDNEPEIAERIKESFDDVDIKSSYAQKGDDDPWL